MIITLTCTVYCGSVVVIVMWSALLVFCCLFLSGLFYLYVFLLSSINITNIDILKKDNTAKLTGSWL